jgi:hypothetical protein
MQSGCGNEPVLLHEYHGQQWDVVLNVRDSRHRGMTDGANRSHSRGVDCSLSQGCGTVPYPCHLASAAHGHGQSKSRPFQDS